MKNQYSKTITACFTAYVVQAVINNFIPLLFLTFQKTYHIPLSQITLLVTFNFGIQLLVDLLAVGFVDRVGYRFSMITAHLLAAAGLLLLTLLPELLPSAFAGILISVMVYAIGGGLLEVLVSPIVEACPSAHKEKAMSMLHSFYCWGHVGSAPALQQPCLCPGSYRFSYRRRPAENELEGTLLPASVLDSADYDALCRRQ